MSTIFLPNDCNVELFCLVSGENFADGPSESESAVLAEERCCWASLWMSCEWERGKLIHEKKKLNIKIKVVATVEERPKEEAVIWLINV